jgi:hypothetical protein
MSSSSDTHDDDANLSDDEIIDKLNQLGQAEFDIQDVIIV